MEKNKDLILHQMKVGPMENFVYLIGSGKTGEAAVVDPGWEADKILEQAKALNLKITHVLLTHTHYDHTDSLADLLSRTKAKVYVHKTESSNLKIPSDKTVLTDHEQKIDIGGIPVRVLHTPGHTSGSQCFEVSGNLISGDTLFVQSCGRTDLPTGSEKQLFQSLALLAELPSETTLLPGHDYGPAPTSTIDDEKRNNPFLNIRKK